MLSNTFEPTCLRSRVAVAMAVRPDASSTAGCVFHTRAASAGRLSARICTAEILTSWTAMSSAIRPMNVRRIIMIGRLPRCSSAVGALRNHQDLGALILDALLAVAIAVTIAVTAVPVTAHAADGLGECHTEH